MPNSELRKSEPVSTIGRRVVEWQGMRRASDPPPDDSIDLSGLWTALRERARFVLATGLLLFAVVMAATLLSAMEFSSSGRLYLGELDRSSGAASGSGLEFAAGAAGDLSSEIEIIKSRALVAKAVVHAGMNVHVEAPGRRQPRVWRWLLSGRDPTLLDATAKELTVIGELAPQSREPLSYSAKFVDAQSYELRDADGRVVARGHLGEMLSLPGAKLALRMGVERPPRVGVDYAITVLPFDDLVDGALGALTVSVPKAAAGEPAKVLTLEFTNGSPLRAATFLRELMQNYLDERLAWKKENATAAEDFVKKQLDTLRQSLDTTEQRLADYRSNTRGVVLDNEAAAMIGQIGKYEEQRVSARLELAALSDIRQVLKSPNPPVEAFLFGEANDTVLSGMATSLAEAQRQLADLEQRFNAAAPDVQQQRAQVDAQLKMIRGYVSSRQSRAQESLRSLNAVIGQFESKLKSVPGAELGLAQLARESEVYSRLYSFLLERQQQTAIAKASTVSQNRVLDAPKVSSLESAPKLPLRFASLLVGLLAGAALVVIRRLTASTFQNESEIHRAAPFVPVLTSVPREVVSFGALRNLARVDPHDLWSNPHSAVAEAFRSLRTNLYRLHGGDAGWVVLVTSPCPGDGKTTSVLSLAALLAADGKSVLVVDADLRKPSHHLWTGTPSDRGLRNVLSGQSSWLDVVHPVSLPYAEFFSIGAGRTGPSELLSGERMRRFLSEVRGRFDFILLDVASFPLLSDALALAQEAHCVLSVIRLQNTPRRVASEHLRTLNAIAPLHGVILNGADPAQSYGYTVYTTPRPSTPLWTRKGLRRLLRTHGRAVSAALAMLAVLSVASVALLALAPGGREQPTPAADGVRLPARLPTGPTATDQDVGLIQQRVDTKAQDWSASQPNAGDDPADVPASGEAAFVAPTPEEEGQGSPAPVDVGATGVVPKRAGELAPSFRSPAADAPRGAAVDVRSPRERSATTTAPAAEQNLPINPY